MGHGMSRLWAVCPCMSSDTEQSALPLSLGAAQPSHPILPQSHWSHSMRRVSLMGLIASTLRPISHGFDAISVSLLLMRPLLGYDGLTPWYVRIAASLVAFTAPFFSKRARRIMVRPSMGRGLFPGTHWLFRAVQDLLCEHFHGAAQPSHPILSQSHWSPSVRREPPMGASGSGGMLFACRTS